MRIRSYYNNRPNAMCVMSEKMDVYFSYETPVAVRDNITGNWYVSENNWGPTTGKHLNLIEADKKLRIPHSKVLEKLAELESK